MNVCENELVIDAKGVSSVEKFLMARIFMYSNVYIHKSSFSAENYLIQVLRRAKELVKQGENLFATSAFKYFLEGNEKGSLSAKGLELFTRLDDHDVMASIKEWQYHDDLILSKLSKAIVERRLPKSILLNEPLTEVELKLEWNRVKEKLQIDDASYFVQQSPIVITPYNHSKSPIKLLNKNGKVEEITSSEHSLLGEVLKKQIIKYHYHTLKIK